MEDCAPGWKRSLTETLNATAMHRQSMRNGSSVPSTSPEQARTPQQEGIALRSPDSLLAELEQADEYVIGVPMHNFGVPSGFSSSGLTRLRAWAGPFPTVSKGRRA